MTAEPQAEQAYPIDHWSYSSLTLFLRNRLMFKKRYILKIYNEKTGPAAVVGKAGHKALQVYYEGNSVDQAMSAGMEYINGLKDDWIEYGKTGSREKIIKDFTQGFNSYIAEAPKYDDIVAVERTITAFVDIGDDKKLALPAKSVSDLIVRTKGGVLKIIDHKFVSSFTESETDKALYMIQALFNYHTVKAEYGVAPESMVFMECKISKNKDGGPQIQPYVVDFSKHRHFFNVFYSLYNQVTKEISDPDTQYLPNFTDFDGDEAFEDYASQIVTVESPIIQHKTIDRKYAEPNYISSKVDLVDNQFLTEEEKIRVKLLEFGLAVEMGDTFTGASVIQYTLKPSRGLKMKTFEAHDQDIAIALKAKYVRIQAPIMGTDQVGIEVPNPNRSVINYDDDVAALLRPGELDIPIGVDVYGKTIIKSLEEMPHLLVAGATGSGKSVMINVAIKAITDMNGPERVRMVLIDPKRVELAQFKMLPHLLAPVIYDEVLAAKTMNWLVEEMEQRYSRLELAGYRNIRDYNDSSVEKMSRIIVVIDEFADLMLQSFEMEDLAKMIGMSNPLTSERAIIRLAQKARAIGIHLILGTQRPSVDVVTGLIKANLPSRIAFATASAVDSKVILDESGAEKLIGRGDMLFLDPHVRQLQRLQGFYL